MSLATAAAPAPVVTKDLWAVLKDEYKAQQKASEAASDAQSGHEAIVILAGGKSCGKTALINRFLEKGSDPSPPPTVGLEYTYGRRTRAAANIKDVVHLWEVGGGPAGTKIVTVPLSAATVHTTAVLLCADLTRPADLASTIELYLSVLSSRIDELLAGLEKRGSKRPKGMRAFAMKKYTTAAAAAATSASTSSLDLPSKTSHPDKSRLALLPIQWALVGTRYDEFRDLPSEVRKHVARLMRYYAHIYGGALVMSSDRDEPALAKTKQLLSHYAFKTAAPKGECTDYNRPMYVPAGSDALSAIFAGIDATSVEDLKATLAAHAAAMPTKPGAAAAKTASAAKVRAWDAHAKKLSTVHRDAAANSIRASAQRKHATAQLPQQGQRLRSTLIATYKQYEIDTSRLATWLVATAESLDCSPQTPSSPKSKTITGTIKRPNPMLRNAKRKARKGADELDPTSLSS
ncbi:Cytoplasmic dynein 2 light intermediate chain 1 [Allomyces arbusculus]|nr:Cytoplasmic dynein 2 light intermediate chain 1 [Allomyces arbusculus]